MAFARASIIGRGRVALRPVIFKNLSVPKSIRFNSTVASFDVNLAEFLQYEQSTFEKILPHVPKDFVPKTTGEKAAYVWFIVASQENAIPALNKDMKKLKFIFTDPELYPVKDILLDPTASETENINKIKLLQKNLSLSPITLSLLGSLAKLNKFKIIEKIVLSYNQSLLQDEIALNALISFAAPPTDVQKLEAESFFKDLLNKQIIFEYTIDPKIVGGLTAQIGDNFYDYSLKNTHQTIKEGLDKIIHNFKDNYLRQLAE